MAEEETIEPTETDIFQQQKKTVELLQDVLLKKSANQGQPVYVTQQSPPAAKKNYTMWLMGAAVFYFLFVKKGRIRL